jgi:hypothetical protein
MKTDEELVSVCGALTQREWARLAVLAADNAGLDASYQSALRDQLTVLESVVPDDATDEQAINELVATDYDGEPELVYEGYNGAAGAARILATWRMNDHGARALIDRLGIETATRMYLASWDTMRRTEKAVAAEYEP